MFLLLNFVAIYNIHKIRVRGCEIFTICSKLKNFLLVYMFFSHIYINYKLIAKNLYARREFLSFEGIAIISQPLTRILCILYVATKLSSWVHWLLNETFFGIQKIYVIRLGCQIWLYIKTKESAKELKTSCYTYFITPNESST